MCFSVNLSFIRLLLSVTSSRGFLTAGRVLFRLQADRCTQVRGVRCEVCPNRVYAGRQERPSGRNLHRYPVCTMRHCTMNIPLHRAVIQIVLEEALVSETRQVGRGAHAGNPGHLSVSSCISVARREVKALGFPHTGTPHSPTASLPFLQRAVQ